MNNGKTRVYCAACNDIHKLTPSAMGVVIVAFQAGNLHRVNTDSKGVVCILPLCILQALADMNIDIVAREYRGSIGWEV